MKNAEVAFLMIRNYDNKSVVHIDSVIVAIISM